MFVKEHRKKLGRILARVNVLFNKLSFYLLGSSLFKFGRTNLNCLDLLEGGELLVYLIDSLLQGFSDIVLSGTLGELGKVGVNNGGQDNLVTIGGLTTNNAHLGNALNTFKVFFNFLGENVLAVLKHDNELDSTCNICVSVGIKVANVTCSEPTVICEYGVPALCAVPAHERV